MITRGMSLNPYVVKPAVYYAKKLVSNEKHCRYNINDKLIAYIEKSKDDDKWVIYNGYADRARFEYLQPAKNYLDTQLKLEGYIILERKITKHQFKKLKVLL